MQVHYMIKKIIFLFLLSLIISVYAYSDDAEPAELAELAENSPYYKTYQKGRKFFEKKQYDKAIKEFKKLIKAKPDFAQPYLNAAMIYEVNKDYKEAIEHYVKYLEHGGKKVEKAKKSIKNIANLKYLTSDTEFEQLRKGDEIYIEGVKLAKEKKYASAIKKFEKSLEIIPYYVKAHYAIGVALNNEEKYLKAYEHFMKVLKYDPDNSDFVETYYYLGLLHDDLLIKDYETALKFYRVYKEKNGSKKVEKFVEPIEKVSALMSKAIRKFQANQPEQAIGILEKALEVKPYDIRIHNNMAAMYIQQDDFNNAENNLEKAIEIKKDVGDTYYNFACLYSKKGDRKKALEYFEKGMKYFSVENIRNSLNDPDLKNLRREKEWTKIIKDYFQ